MRTCLPSKLTLIGYCLAVLGLLFFSAHPVAALILVEIPGLPEGSRGGATVEGYTNVIAAESISFGVERDLSSSGGKGGTADINIGIGELSEVSITKGLDNSSPLLFQHAVAGISIGTVIIHLLRAPSNPENTKPIEYMRIKLEGAFVKQWAASGDADDLPTEDLAFMFNKIAWQLATTKDGATYQKGAVGAWDNVNNKLWTDPGTLLPD